MTSKTIHVKLKLNTRLINTKLEYCNAQYALSY